MMPETAITICICTFRRPQIAATLASLKKLQLEPNWNVRVVVVDNDFEPTARGIVAKAAEQLSFPVTYLHAPANNISIARNACLEAATGDYMAFIDDDETVTSRWLTELVAVAQKSGAQAVLGPVRALYDAGMPEWMIQGDFHSTFPVFVKGEIVTGYTCNVLMDRRSDKISDLRFDLSRGKSGGEDTDFFARLHRRGGRISYAENAWIEEVVPQSRASLKWLSSRRFRSGQTHGRIVSRDNPQLMARLSVLMMAAAKAAYCFGTTAFGLVSPVQWRRNYLRGMLHLGAISALIGAREIEQYGAVLTDGKSANVGR
ncbi:glycosyltransferase family 2 protein [Hyphomicrobiales bacterium]